MKTLHNLKLHEVQLISDQPEGAVLVLRVPGGWVYEIGTKCVFVPYSSEFDIQPKIDEATNYIEKTSNACESMIDNYYYMNNYIPITENSLKELRSYIEFLIDNGLKEKIGEFEIKDEDIYYKETKLKARN